MTFWQTGKDGLRFAGEMANGKNMGLPKWIGGILGWVSGGPIGALLGVLAGSAVEHLIEWSMQITDGSERFGGAGQAGNYGRRQSGYGQGSSGYGNGSAGGYSRSNSGAGARTYHGWSAAEQRNSFFVSLLVLSSAVIKADGKTHPAELRTVQEFMRRNFGESAAQEAMSMLEQLSSQQVNIYSVGPQIAANMNYSQRLQLLNYLIQIATSDGDFSSSEKSVLEAIASVIGIRPTDAASAIAMYYRDADSAYSVLGISPSATDDEVKSAYRRMAMKNHPDKVATLGPDVQKAASEKFRKIQQAYETIKQKRGMS